MMNRISLIIAAALALLPLVSFAGDSSAVNTGRTIYDSVCIACHAAENVMVAAPKAGDTAEWQRRLSRAANGLETLTDHAVDGFAAMPPKGGRDELTRDEIRRAIAYMMAQPGKGRSNGQ